MPDKILIVQLADIGDLVLSTPALAALRAARPEAHLTLLTSSHAAPVVEGTGLVDEIITFDKKVFGSLKALLKPAHLRQIFNLRRGHYDALLFFHHFTLKAGTLKFALMALATGARRRIGLQNGNGWFLTESIPDAGFGVRHQAQYWLDLVGLLGADTSPRPAKIAITKEDSPSLPIEYALPVYEGEGGWGLRIAIHSGSGGYSLARRWEPEKFAAVADALHEQFNAQIVLVGGAGDDTAQVKAAMKTTALDLSGLTTLPELAGVLNSCDLYIGADSGVTHIAASVGIPVLAIFGPSNHEA
ncbi:MAG: glycosyltransferase family 9 protein, partial [Chitinophagaceae bacterium]|nr:glycosyltransferase family 9 protein [Anaerolineae bacterium]